MSTQLKVPQGAWILVADGSRALVFENAGSAQEPKLEMRNVLNAPENPAAHEQGTHRPGRTFAGGPRRSAVAATDWHDVAKGRFAREITDMLNRAHKEHPLRALILVAAPRTLADLRKHLGVDLERLLCGEVDKDLTKCPVHEIERHLFG